MRKFLIGTVIGAATLMTAAPAMAQSKDAVRPADRTAVRGFEGRIGSAQQRIDWLAERRQISGRQYRALRTKSAALRERLYDVSSDGFSRGERDDMAQQVSDFRERITDARDAR